MTESVILEQKAPQTGSASALLSRRQRLYIFPTRHGLVYAVMLAVMLLGAINYTNNMAYMLTFMLGSLFMVCMLHTYRNLRGLIVTVSEARPAFAGDIARFPVVFDNRYGLRRININIDVWPAQWKTKRSSGEGIRDVRIDAAQLYREFLQVPANQRGYLSPGRIKIHSCFPLGLFQSWSYLPGRSRCLVYPRPHGEPRLPALTEDISRDQTGSLSGTDDFTGFRHYRAGDSIRNIDWKIYAREQGLLVKKFSGSGARKLVLHWDQTAQLPDVEARLSQLTLWVLQAELAGLRYGLVMPGVKLDINHGETHQQSCLRELALYGKDARP
jgi:uncharacterized protein (DUF58 family)